MLIRWVRASLLNCLTMRIQGHIAILNITTRDDATVFGRRADAAQQFRTISASNGIKLIVVFFLYYSCEV